MLAIEMDKFKEISSTEIFRGDVYKVYSKLFEDPEGKRFYREIIERDDSIGIIATFHNSDRALFVLEWSGGINDWVLSIPGGRTTESDSNLKIEIVNELKEETGFSANNIKKLYEFCAMPGYMKRFVTLFSGSIISKRGEQDLDDFEYIKYKIFSINSIIDKAINNTLEYKIDPEALLALMLWKSLKT